MLKVVELFSGIGSQKKALINLNINHKIVAVSEIDKNCDKAYNLIHNEKSNNLGDITKIKELPKCDLITYSFPCQDISNIGKQKGFTKDSKTRSSLLWEVGRLIVDLNNRNELPKYLVCENVKSLFSKKFENDLKDWETILEELGYVNHKYILNGINFNIPQKRERAFIISIRKDLKQDFKIELNKITDLTTKDFLEDNNKVEEKYLTTKIISEKLNLKNQNEFNNFILENDYENKILNKGIMKLPIYTFQQQNMYNTENSICHTITRSGAFGTPRLIFKDNLNNFQTRKFKPIESWKLMGFTKEDFLKVEGKFSNSVLYQMAGNSIIVNVLEGIFKELFLLKKVKIKTENLINY
jgi:DNA (cytosine-5)-methyltransferase 1